MGEVVSFRGVTKLDLNPDQTLEGLKGSLKGFVLIGYDLEDNTFFSSTYAEGGDVLWLIEKLKHMLMNVE